MTKNPDDAPANVLQQIGEICREFGKQLSKGEPTRVEELLKQVPWETQEHLFGNLIGIEVNYRRSKGESPTSDEYIKRFPQYKQQVRRAFFEPSMGSVDSFSSNDGDDHTESIRSPNQNVLDPTFELPDANQLGKYQLLRELGRGAFGIVYEARHSRRNQRVALKLLPTNFDHQDVNVDRLLKFRREFRSLSEINHPNLVGMQTLEVDGSQWFFTMDLIQGEDFLSWVRPLGETDEPRLRNALEQLAAGISFLHRNGIVHRDLKPSNVLVENSGRVVILDFGLIAQLQTNADMTVSKSGMFAGTPRYAAPEQMFGQRSEASDWYALGTMLYEALTGQPPFMGKQLELLQQKQNEDPPCLADENKYPHDLAALADGLLKREPQRRITTDQLIEALQLDLATRSYGSTQQSRGSRGSSGSQSSNGSADDELNQEQFETEDEEQLLIGREQQLAALENQKTEFLAELMPRAIWLSGRSGEGKSTLAEAFLRPIRQSREMVVLSGRCYDRESVPFKAIDCLIDSLVRFLRSSRGKPFASELPEDIGFLAKLFPLLNRVESIAERRLHLSSPMEPEKLRARGFYALRQLFLQVSKELPIILLIDDLQWADADSAQALVDILTQQPRPAMMLLGSYRSDEADKSTFLQTWQRLTSYETRQLESQTIAVSSLTREQCLELAASRLHLESEQIAAELNSLFQESSGNPYLLEQLLAGFDRDTGKFQARPLNELVAHRLRHLPDEATNLLEVIAISGQPIRADEAAQVVGMEEADYSLLTHMRSERLVRLMGDRNDAVVDTYHDKIRETVLANLSQDRRQVLHLQLAQTIEAQEGYNADQLRNELIASSTPCEFSISISSRVFELAHHFHEADEPQAFIYQLVAAEQALQANSAEDALGYYIQVEKKIAVRSQAQLEYRFWLGMGQVLLWNRNAEGAAQAYQNAVAVAASNFDRARAYAGLSQVSLQVSQLKMALDYCDKGLEELGVRRPRSTIGKLWAFTWSAGKILFLPPNWMRVKSAAASRDALLKSSLCHTCADSTLEIDTLAAADLALRSNVYAIQRGGQESLELGYARAAMDFSVLGLQWPGRKCLKRVRQDSPDAQAPTVWAATVEAHALAFYWVGQPEKGRNRIAGCNYCKSTSWGVISYARLDPHS